MKTIVCYGDSNTHGYNPMDGLRFPRDVRWTGRLQKLLGDDYYVVEEGCNGRTTVFKDPKEPWKCGRSYLRACLNTHKPIDIFVMMLGSNDMKKIFHASPNEIAAGAGELVDIVQNFLKAKEGGSPKVLLIAPPHLRRGIGKGPFGKSFSETAVIISHFLGSKYKKIAKDKGCYFLDASEIVVASEKDQLHLMDTEHEKLAMAVADMIKHMGEEQ